MNAKLKIRMNNIASELFSPHRNKYPFFIGIPMLLDGGNSALVVFSS